MADVRSLLAAERQARRIQHPYLTYTKSGQLLCNVCNLNVKSETLWTGHLKSTNHRKNAQAAEDKRTKTLKRKLGDVEESLDEEDDAGREANKKSRSRIVSVAEQEAVAEEQPPLPTDRNGLSDQIESERTDQVVSTEEPESSAQDVARKTSGDEAVPEPDVDADEFAAFEREIASLEQPETSTGTITAAPMTAEQLAKQADEDKRQKEELDIDAEKEEEDRRVEEEIEVMEDLGERVRKLKEKREALRLGSGAATDTGQAEIVDSIPADAKAKEKEGQADEENETDESDIDDWYS